MQSSNCLIIAGGQENRIKDYFPEDLNRTYIIACDKGYEYCKNQDVVVDYLCGDFDSCKIAIPTTNEISDGVDVLPSHKDDTDLIHAIKYARKKGFEKIFITCAGGGRVDHFLSNIQALVFAKTGDDGISENKKIDVLLYDDLNVIRVIKNEELVLAPKDGWSLTVLSYTDKSEGVTIKGAEYEVSDVTLTNGFPLGQSNEWKNENVSISVKEGILLVIFSKL